jgi:hypothetical protein
LRQRLDPKELAAGDPHHDSTLTKSEYLAVVEKQFRAADPDNDATLDAKELRSPAGRVVIRLTMWCRILEEAMIRMALDQRRRPFAGGAPWLSRQFTPANRVASAG